MNVKTTRFLICTGFVLSLSHLVLAQDPAANDFSNPDMHIRALGKKYYFACEDATTIELAALRRQSDDGLAIRAAWEDIRRTIPRVDAKTASSADANKSHAVDRAKIARFLGYVEGRLNVGLPDWWVQRFQKTRVHAIAKWKPRVIAAIGGPFVLLARPLEHDINPTRVTKAGWVIFRDLKMRTSPNGTITIETDGKTANLPKELTDNANSISAIRLGDEFIIATYYEDGYGCDICRLKANGELVWKERAWGEISPSKNGLGYHHWVELVVEKDRLFIFGGTDNSMYLECFRHDDGANEFRFGTSY